jgi:polyisoprenoid-binding protein YceI
MNRLAAFVAAVLLMGAGAAHAEPKPASLDPAAAPAGVYALDKSHASLTASLSHMGMSHYTMRFDVIDASFTYDPKAPEASKVAATIDARSLDVGNPKFSTQFANEFLDAEKAPRITFTATAIKYDGVHGTMTGDLTLRGVTRPVTLDVTFNGTGPGLIGGHRMGFSATGDIKRSDFGSKAWLSVVGDEVHIVIEAEFQRK